MAVFIQVAHGHEVFLQQNGFNIVNGSTGVNATLIGAQFINASLENITLTNSSCENTNFKQANLSNAVFNCTKLNSANFTNANLSGAKLEGVELRGTLFTNANLDNTSITLKLPDEITISTLYSLFGTPHYRNIFCAHPTILTTLYSHGLRIQYSN